jgi:hypothetical protein
MVQRLHLLLSIDVFSVFILVLQGLLTLIGLFNLSGNNIRQQNPHFPDISNIAELIPEEKSSMFLSDGDFIARPVIFEALSVVIEDILIFIAVDSPELSEA